MSETTPPSRASLRYVSDMLDQLRSVAAENGGPFLTYLIDMAKTEADAELQRQGGKPSRLSREKRHPAV